jgi:hypothetical protein
MATILEIRLRIESDVPIDPDVAGESIALMASNFGIQTFEGASLTGHPGAEVTYLSGYSTIAPPAPKVITRAATYRGEPGFTVSSSGGERIFTRTKSPANRIADRLRDGEATRSEDFNA